MFFRTVLSALILAVLATVSAFGAETAAPQGEVNAFIYHRFAESRYPSTNIATDVFAAQLAYLKENRVEVCALADIVERLKSGRHLPAKGVVLTVDDAFSSFLQDGMPLLRRYGYPVTLFVNTDSVGSKGYLSWDELRNLVKEGVVIGNHSASHDYLIERRQGETSAQWRQRVTDDIQRAQVAFERELGLRPILFAYPYGEFSPQLVELVKGLGFTAAIAQQSGVISPGSDLFALPRFPMGGGYATLEQFHRKLAMHPLPVEPLVAIDPVVATNPPAIRVRIDADSYDLRRLQGFVQGENRLLIEKIAGSQSEYLVRAEKPLTGRRNKYTLTAPGKKGGWGWFSQPWFLVGRSE